MKTTFNKFNIVKRHFLTKEVCNWDIEEKNSFKVELQVLFRLAFPKMTQETINDYTKDFFRTPGMNFTRHLIVYREENKSLVAVTILDLGSATHQNKTFQSGYWIVTAILPAYQGRGMGKKIGAEVLNEFQPDIFFGTYGQSASLHSRLGLIAKGLVSGYDVLPRLCHKKKQRLEPLSAQEMEFVTSIFRQVYIGVLRGDQVKTDKAVQNLTPYMVRKNIYSARYDFNPWQKFGMEDRLAPLLGVTSKDGVLLMFYKKNTAF